MTLLWHLKCATLQTNMASFVSSGPIVNKASLAVLGPLILQWIIAVLASKSDVRLYFWSILISLVEVLHAPVTKQ